MKITDIREEVRQLEHAYTHYVAQEDHATAQRVLETKTRLLEIQAEDVYHLLVGTHKDWTN